MWTFGLLPWYWCFELSLSLIHCKKLCLLCTHWKRSVSPACTVRSPISSLHTVGSPVYSAYSTLHSCPRCTLRLVQSSYVQRFSLHTYVNFENALYRMALPLCQHCKNFYLGRLRDALSRKLVHNDAEGKRAASTRRPAWLAGGEWPSRVWFCTWWAAHAALPWRTTPLALVWGWSITRCT